MLTPSNIEEIDNKNYNVDNIIEKIDKSIKDNHEKYNYEYGSYEKILPFSVRERIAKSYNEAGWNYVYHRIVEQGGYLNKGISEFIFANSKLFLNTGNTGNDYVESKAVANVHFVK